jgi:transcription termination/antitermination protein NusA
MFDLKVIHSVLNQLEEERGVPKDKIIEAIEMALATAYKKEYGKKGQVVRTKFDINTGDVEFYQVKKVADESRVYFSPEEKPEIVEATEGEEVEEMTLYNPEYHILIEDAQKIKKDSQLDDEIVFPLEVRDDYGRIASQTAKQVIMQKIREAEKTSVLAEYGKREGEVISGMVQRVERGTIFIDLGRATGILPFEEQIRGERFSQGQRLRALLMHVDESTRGVFLRLSRSHSDFLKRLFESEVPELLSGSVEVKAIAREAGSRSKIAVIAHDDHIDPVGSLVGQRGVRVSTVMSELGGEKIDIIEWSEDTSQFIEEALSPAKIVNVTLEEGEERRAIVEVAEDQQSLAIGKGGQNVRLAAKLTGWRIDIRSIGGEEEEAPEKTAVEEVAPVSEEVAEAPAEETPAVVEEVVEETAPAPEEVEKNEEE